MNGAAVVTLACRPAAPVLSRCCRAPVAATLCSVRCSRCSRTLPPHLLTVGEVRA